MSAKDKKTEMFCTACDKSYFAFDLLNGPTQCPYCQGEGRVWTGGGLASEAPAT